MTTTRAMSSLAWFRRPPWTLVSASNCPGAATAPFCAPRGWEWGVFPESCAGCSTPRGVLNERALHRGIASAAVRVGPFIVVSGTSPPGPDGSKGSRPLSLATAYLGHFPDAEPVTRDGTTHTSSAASCRGKGPVRDGQRAPGTICTSKISSTPVWNSK
jgi:hypothetical protein